MQQKSTAALKMKSGRDSFPAIFIKNSEKVKDMTTPFAQKQKTRNFTS